MAAIAGLVAALDTIAVNAAQLAHHLARSLDGNDAALLVTSNGILKFLLKLVPGAFEKMASEGCSKSAPEIAARRA